MSKEKMLLILQYMLWLLIGCIVISFIASNKTLSAIILTIMFGCYLGKRLAKRI